MKMNSYYEFSNLVEIIAGDENFEHTIDKLRQMGVHNILVVSSNKISESGVLDKILNAITSKMKVNVSSIFLDVPKVPNLECVQTLFDFYHENSCDSILACGGNEVVSVAKLLKLLLSTQTRDIREHMGIDFDINKKSIPFGVISTTLGSGSEVSKISVLYDNKKSISNEYVTEVMLPDFCTINPDFTKMLSEEDTFSELIAVLAKAIESYVSLKSNIATRNMIRIALFEIKLSIRQILHARRDKIEDDQNLDYRFNMQRSGVLTGIAYSNSFVGVNQALANSICSYTGIPYNDIVYTTIIGCMEYNKNVCAKEYSEILLCLLGADKFAAIARDDRPDALIDYMRKTIAYGKKQYSKKTKLSEFNVEESDLEKIAEIATMDSAIITNPRFVDKEDILAILKSIY